MNPLAKYIPVIELIAVVLLLGGFAWGTHWWNDRQQQIGYDRAQAEYAAKALLAEQKARATETELRKQLEDAQNAATQREQVIRSTAAAASAASVSLRDTLTTIRNGVPTATVEALRNATVALTDVFGDCQAKYRGLAEKADRHASDVKTLSDAWPIEKVKGGEGNR